MCLGKVHNNRDDRSPERIVKRSRFENLGWLHKERTESGVSVSRAPTHRRVQEIGCECHIPSVKPPDNIRSVSPEIRRKKDRTISYWSKVVFSG